MHEEAGIVIVVIPYSFAAFNCAGGWNQAAPACLMLHISSYPISHLNVCYLISHPCCTGGRSRYDVQRDIKAKEKARETLAK
jgi:hypothetical protein